MIFDFRVLKDDVKRVMINQQEVETVNEYKYLGTVIDDKLNGKKNAQRIYKKANQRLYIVRKLK